MDSIAGDYHVVDGEAWLGAAPLKEFIDRVSITYFKRGALL